MLSVHVNEVKHKRCDSPIDILLVFCLFLKSPTGKLLGEFLKLMGDAYYSMVYSSISCCTNLALVEIKIAAGAHVSRNRSKSCCSTIILLLLLYYRSIISLLKPYIHSLHLYLYCSTVCSYKFRTHTCTCTCTGPISQPIG